MAPPADGLHSQLGKSRCVLPTLHTETSAALTLYPHPYLYPHPHIHPHPDHHVYPPPPHPLHHPFHPIQTLGQFDIAYYII